MGRMQVSNVVVAKAAERSEGHGVAGWGAQTYGVALGDDRGGVLVKVAAAGTGDAYRGDQAVVDVDPDGLAGQGPDAAHADLEFASHLVFGVVLGAAAGVRVGAGAVQGGVEVVQVGGLGRGYRGE
jgi:hypothetical protein